MSPPLTALASCEYFFATAGEVGALLLQFCHRLVDVGACLLLGGLVGVLRDADEDVGRVNGFRLLELVGVLLVEVVDFLVADVDARLDVGLDQLHRQQLLADVVLQPVGRHLALRERGGERLFVRELLANLADLAVDLGVGHRDLARLRFLREELERDELIEDLTVDCVTPVGRHRAAGLCLERLQRAVELGAIDRASPLTRASTSGSCAGTGFGAAGCAAAAGAAGGVACAFSGFGRGLLAADAGKTDGEREDGKTQFHGDL